MQKTNQVYKISKCQFSTNVISGAARDFFCLNCFDGMSTEQLANVMVWKYDSDARRHAEQSEFETLRIESFMS